MSLQSTTSGRESVTARDATGAERASGLLSPTLHAPPALLAATIAAM